MADELSSFRSSIEYFEHFIRNIVLNLFENTSSYKECSLGVKLLRPKDRICSFVADTRARSRDSDLVVRTNSLGRLKSEEVKVLHDEICQCTEIKKYLFSSYVDRYRNIQIVLNRKIFINDIFKMVMKHGIKYGQKECARASEPEKTEESVLINCSISTKNESDNTSKTIDQLRTLLLCNHLAEILKQSRLNIDVCYSDHHHADLCELKCFGILQLNNVYQDDRCCEETPEELESFLWQNVLKSPYRDNVMSTADVKEQDESGSCLDKELIDSLNVMSTECSCAGRGALLRRTKQRENVWLNITKFVEDLWTLKGTTDNNQGCNRNGFNSFYKNVKHVNVPSVWNDVTYLERLKHTTKKIPHTKVLHVCSQDKLVHWQKVSLTWKLLTHPENMLAQNQMFLCHARYTTLSSSKVPVSVDELLRIRKKQVKHSYYMKYGSIVDGESWTETITRMAVSVIKLEIFLIPLNSQVKLDVRENDQFPPVARQALFVLYNCARLAKILDKYDKDVQKGIYPALPRVSDVDFSLLKDQAEWDLVLKYVASYPATVENTTSYGESLILKKFTSNKISHFLVSLSQDISSYYSRVHILGEAREHLYPVLFARLYLVKVLYQVMQNALKLLTIEAIDQM